MLRWVLLAATLLCTLAAHAAWVGATLADQDTRLVLTRRGATPVAAPVLTEQVAFSDVKRSADRRHVGWLAMFGNCCTSYPVAMQLVVLDEHGALHTFDGERLPIFDWCFVPGRRAVAFRQGVLHGTDAMHFELRRIADGRRIAQYDYPHEERAQARARRHAPRWVKCVPE
jgi:hypothetical protein